MDMNEREQRDLERRLSASLHAAAPRPDPHLADRLLAATAEAPQRRGFLRFAVAPVLAASAVLVAAIAVGIGIGALLPQGPEVGGPSASASEDATPISATPSASPSAAPSSTAPATASCENTALGFVVSYPAEWWANEAVASELTPIEACRYFAEEPVEILPNAGLPEDVAILAHVDEAPAGNPQQPIRVLEEREVEVAGRPATVREIEWTEDTGFQQAGDRSYAYRIVLPSGETLLFGTLDQAPSERYEARKAVLDAMVESLRLSGG